MSIPSELMANVLRGVRLLDEKDSQWWNGGGESQPAIALMVGHIDLATLDLSEPYACVLGQRHLHGYGGAVGVLFDELNSEVTSRHGFNCLAVGDEERQFSILTELWASVIQSRRFPRRKIAKDPWVMKANKSWRRTA